MNNDKWVVIQLGPQDGYGIATRRVTMLELYCSGMTMENAKTVCDMLNQASRARTPRRD
jgi:hypothetical protein